MKQFGLKWHLLQMSKPFILQIYLVCYMLKKKEMNLSLLDILKIKNIKKNMLLTQKNHLIYLILVLKVLTMVTLVMLYLLLYLKIEKINSFTC